MVQIARKRTPTEDKRLCACGCGELIDRYDKRGTERHFKIGHNMRGKPINPNRVKQGQEHWN